MKSKLTTTLYSEPVEVLMKKIQTECADQEKISAINGAAFLAVMQHDLESLFLLTQVFSPQINLIDLRHLSGVDLLQMHIFNSKADRKSCLSFLLANGVNFSHNVFCKIYFGEISNDDLNKLEKNELTDAQGFNVLHYAAANGQIEILKLLLEKFPKLINNTSCLRTSPLHVATLNGHAEVVDLLIKSGADLELPDYTGRTAGLIATTILSNDILQKMPEALRVSFAKKYTSTTQKSNTPSSPELIHLVFNNGAKKRPLTMEVFNSNSAAVSKKQHFGESTAPTNPVDKSSTEKNGTQAIVLT